MMPLYDYACDNCGWTGEQCPHIEDRDAVSCPECQRLAQRRLSAPYGRIAGRTLQGGGPDRFTADALGMHIKDLPDALKV